MRLDRGHQAPHSLAAARRAASPPSRDDDIWELYGPDDWTQSRDLAAEQPAVLHRLQRLWLIEATKHGVLPLDGRGLERFIPELAGRPELIRGNTQVLFPGMGHLNESSVIVIKNRSHAVTAQVAVSDAGAEGVIVSQGGMAGGWSLYCRDGRLRYCYNLVGLQYFYADSDVKLPAIAMAEHQVRMEFTYDGLPAWPKAAPSRSTRRRRRWLLQLPVTQAVVFSADEVTHVGRESGSPVAPDYPAGGTTFTGEIRWVQIDVDEAATSQEHLIPIEERPKIATTQI